MCRNDQRVARTPVADRRREDSGGFFGTPVTAFVEAHAADFLLDLVRPLLCVLTLGAISEFETLRQHEVGRNQG